MGIMSTPGGRARHFTAVNQGVSRGSQFTKSQHTLEFDGPPARSRRQGYLAQHHALSATRAQARSRTSQAPIPESLTTQLPPQLPIVPYKEQIVRTINENPYTILVAPTGTGKTTMLPLFLLEAGYDQIIVTNPRRVPCVQVAERVAHLDGTSVGERIGYRHGLKQEVSSDCEVIFTTEGYQLERELKRREQGKRVYILDEAHEFTANWEVLLVLLRESMQRGDDIKIVIATATLESHKLASYLGNDGRSVAVIDIPVKHYDIREIDPGSNRSVASNLEGGTLAFLWGKGRIGKVADALQSMKPHIRPIPFHSELPHKHQRAALDAFDKGNGALLATNCLQASVTVPKVTRVVSEGWVRRERVGVDGERHLAIEECSQHEITQQKGRTGRVGPGEFILVGGGRPRHLRRKEAPAETELKPLDSLVLRVHSSGRSFERLNNQLFHPAPLINIHRAVKSNQLLNLLGPSGYVAPSAAIALGLPIEPNSMKTIAEAYRLTTQLNLAASKLLVPTIDLVAVIESEGIVSREFDDSRFGSWEQPGAAGLSRWRRFCDDNLESDALAQMQLFQVLQRGNADAFAGWGVDLHRFHNAMELRAQLLQRLLIDPSTVAATDLPKEEKDLLLQKLKECHWSGNINRLYRYVGRDARSNKRQYKPVFGDGELRELSSECGLRPGHLFIAGEPITIDKEPYDHEPLYFITMASAVEPYWLRAKARGSDLIKEAKEPIFEALKRAWGQMRAPSERELQRYHRPTPHKTQYNRR